MSDRKELFRALELAHYAERFRESVFVIALPAGASFQELLLDFKVLAGYQIQVVLVTQDPEFRLEQIIGLANKRGSRFHLSLFTDLLFGPEADLQLDFQRIRDVLAQKRTPVIAYHQAGDGVPPAGDGTVEATYALAAEVAGRLEAKKLFLIHPKAGQMREGLPRSHVLAGEMEELPARLERAGLTGLEGLLAFVRRQLERGIPDVVLVEGRSAYLFQEVFTHDGAGLLCSAVRSARIRQAVMKDVTDIALLLRPEVEAGRIRPTSENQIEAGIRNYQVYDIDGLLVGVACLKNYGEDAELAQFATLPRYRGKGRARDLALALIEAAQREGYRRVFALSIDERMWEFFQTLGFHQVERDRLPEAWRRSYDMSRRSRAYQKEL